MADLKNKLSYGRKGEVASSNATGGVEIATPEIRTETDPTDVSNDRRRRVSLCKV